MTYETIHLRFEPPAMILTLQRETINRRMIEEMSHALGGAAGQSHIVVVEGAPDVFCLGANFHDYGDGVADAADPEALYDLWAHLAKGPFVSVAHVRGRANAGGLGFVAACDIALADAQAEFSLSELLFGLFPACVTPFLVRRVGVQRAHFMTLTTLPVSAEQAALWGLVDACDKDSGMLLRRLLMRLKRISPSGVRRYKRYVETLADPIGAARAAAIAANREMFEDPANRAALQRYARTGMFPWESEGDR